MLYAAVLPIENLVRGLRASQANRDLSPAEAQNLALKVGELERAETALQHQALEARSLEARARQVGERAQEEIETEQFVEQHGGCFVAGTLVWMGDGTTKSIEQIKVGDLVLSRDSATDQTAAKKVLHTSVRQGIWARKLTFEGGTILEVTDEHPLYVEGQGFRKAKEIGIGSSIVTRAGPASKITGVQADARRAMVYNFTVDEFHTYFVGNSALWVHNIDDCTKALIDAKSISTYPPKALEGWVGGWVEDVMTPGGFNSIKTSAVDGKKYEIDVALIEVTMQKGDKYTQVERLLTDRGLNPSAKDVILYSPYYEPAKAKAIENLGDKVWVVRTKEDLLVALDLIKQRP